MQALAFGAHNDGAIHVVVQFVVALVAALIKADDPDVFRLQFVEGAGDVDHAGHADVLTGSGRCLDHGARNARSATLGNDHAIHPRSIGRADQRAQVVRVLNAIQHQQEAVFTVFMLQQFLHAGVLFAGGDGHDTLVGVGAGFAIKFFARHKTHGDALGAAVIENCLQTVVGAVSRDRNIVKAPPAALQCFANGMDAIDDFTHTYLVYGTRA